MKTFVYALALFALLAGMLFSPFSAAPVSAASCGDTYTVKAGDYLTKIARNCGVDYAALLKANPEIKDVNKIFPGQVIRIKAGASIPGTNNPTPTPAPTGSGEYIVAKGDTLFKIAVRFNTTTAELLKINPEIKDANKIFVGQKIRVSGSAVGTSFLTLSIASLKPGESLEVKVKGFPANADIDFRLGVDGKAYSVVVDGKTNANGETSAKLTIPTTAKAGEKWVVKVLTTGMANGKEAVSPVIMIK